MADIGFRIKKILTGLPDNVSLVAVSKFHTIEVLQQAYDAGLRIFGESRVQEIERKHTALPKDIQWHFIGHLQTNKIKYIIPYVALIQSVDSLKLLTLINHESEKIGKITNILLQLHVAKEDTKFGFSKEDCIELVESGIFRDLKNINVCGVMGMATNTDDRTEVRNEFKLIKEIFQTLKAIYFNNNDSFSVVSMGMSHDYHIALEEGTNMVRIGTSIFGERQY